MEQSLNTIKPILLWLASLSFSVVIMPWTMVTAIKLALWPSLLSDYEKGVIVSMKGDLKSTTPVTIILDIFAVGVLSLLTPMWLAVYLWMALGVSYLFLLEVQFMAEESKH